VLLGRGL